jgi:hypothetical protein
MNRRGLDNIRVAIRGSEHARFRTYRPTIHALLPRLLCLLRSGLPSKLLYQR